MNIKKHYFHLGKPATIEELHEQIRTELSFPDYYGANLDALYDALTDICTDTVVAILLPEETKIDPDYLDRVCQVFEDAEQDNPFLELFLFRLTDRP